VKGRGRRGGFTVPHQKAEVGITPFRPEDEVSGFYDSPKFKRFQHDMRRIAAKDHVTIDKAVPAAGVWEGETEPSLAVDAHDGEAGVDGWAAELGKKYDQDGVLLFHPDPAGDSATYSFPLGKTDQQVALDAMKQRRDPRRPHRRRQTRTGREGHGFPVERRQARGLARHELHREGRAHESD